MDCYLFDLDGTLADCGHRLHHIVREPGDGRPKDWAAFYAACDRDAPIPHMVSLAQRLAYSCPVIYVTGRSDECRMETRIWLQEHELPVGALYMRKAGDHRHDDIVKLELLEVIKADGHRPLMAFEDRSRVVAALRAAGIPCAQVAEGNF